MSLSKLTLLSHLKTLTTTISHRHRLPLISLRHLSFSTPEEAAAERRKRKRDLRIQPPLNSLRHQSQPQRRPQTPIQNPNSPKLPEHISILTGKRLSLHNQILNLIRMNDLDEASLLTRHSIYSNNKPTIFTCNAVMTALLRQSRYSDLLTLHRFITQAGVVPNVVTHNLLINAYCDCRKTDTALEHYKVLVNDAPFSPSPTTYRILVKGLVDNMKVERALELKDDMFDKGLLADSVVYNYLMFGVLKNGDADKAVELFEELKEKQGGFVSDGIVYGNLMKAYFLKGMEKEAMEYYNDLEGENSSIKMGAASYNYVLQAFIQNRKLDEAIKLFDRMLEKHSRPIKLTVDLGSFNVMADGYCQEGRYEEAIRVFRSMGEKSCCADTLSYNSLIEKLCAGGKVSEAEAVYGDMGEVAKPDEITHILLIEACFGQNRPEDAAGYFDKMVEIGLKPNVNAYSKVVEGLIKAGKVDEANGFFSQMIEKLKLEAANYELMLRALCETNKLDDVLKLVGVMLRDERVGLNAEMDELVRDALRKEEREDDLMKLFEEKEREDKEKAEAAAKKAEEEKAAAAAAEAAKRAPLTPGTLSFLNGLKSANGNANANANSDVASADTISGNGESTTDTQVETGEVVAAETSPVEEAEVVAEAIESSGPETELKTSDDDSETAESKTSADGVVEQVTV
ncbi:hypothetical protein ACHQM5_011903 [Ranunculus cassubicifolius]